MDAANKGQSAHAAQCLEVKRETMVNGCVTNAFAENMVAAGELCFLMVSHPIPRTPLRPRVGLNLAIPNNDQIKNN